MIADLDDCRGNAAADQQIAYHLRTLQRKQLILGRTTDRIGMPNDADIEIGSVLAFSMIVCTSACELPINVA